MKHDAYFKQVSIALIIIWLSLFALIPHVFIIMSSLLKYPTHYSNVSFYTLEYYKLIAGNLMYFKVFLRSFQLAATCTCLCLIIAYPFTYLLSQISYRYKNLLFAFILVPFWTSSLIRTHAIISILKAKGLLNQALLTLGLIKTPFQLLHTHTAVLIGLVYDLLPFMILPLYASFEKIDPMYIHAARDLGANTRTILYRIILPLTKPGILNGSLFVFLPAMSLFYIPDTLGGAKSLLLGNLIQQQFLTGNWGLGSALSIILLILLMFLLLLGRLFQKSQNSYSDFL